MPFVPLTSHILLHAVFISLIELTCETFWFFKDVMVNQKKLKLKDIIGKNP